MKILGALRAPQGLHNAERLPEDVATHCKPHSTHSGRRTAKTPRSISSGFMRRPSLAPDADRNARDQHFDRLDVPYRQGNSDVIGQIEKRLGQKYQQSESPNGPVQPNQTE